jgi:hypothetical protein
MKKKVGVQFFGPLGTRGYRFFFYVVYRIAFQGEMSGGYLRWGKTSLGGTKSKDKMSRG